MACDAVHRNQGYRELVGSGAAPPKAVERSTAHYERSGALEHGTWALYDLWHWAIEADPK